MEARAGYGQGGLDGRYDFRFITLGQVCASARLWRNHRDALMRMVSELNYRRSQGKVGDNAKKR